MYTTQSRKPSGLFIVLASCVFGSVLRSRISVFSRGVGKSPNTSCRWEFPNRLGWPDSASMESRLPNVVSIGGLSPHRGSALSLQAHRVFCLGAAEAPERGSLRGLFRNGRSEVGRERRRFSRGAHAEGPRRASASAPAPDGRGWVARQRMSAATSAPVGGGWRARGTARSPYSAGQTSGRPESFAGGSPTWIEQKAST